MLNRISSVILIAGLIGSCDNQKEAKEGNQKVIANEPPSDSINWVLKKQITLEGISPVGLALDGENLWLADTDNNRLVKTDLDGNVLERIPNIQRPMHIDFTDGKLYITEYLTDTISYFREGKKWQSRYDMQFDAPAGISAVGITEAVADFYNHRIILKEGDKEIIIGKKGYGKGGLFYPTDVKLYQGKVYVADAYNNRMQVFDREGNSLLILGKKEKIKVATGIEVAGDHIFITDFERNRVLIYSLEGELKQILIESFDKPADVLVDGNLMYVANYGGGTISVIEKK